MIGHLARYTTAALLGIFAVGIWVANEWVNLLSEAGMPKGWMIRAWDDVAKPAKPDSEWAITGGMLRSGRQRGNWLLSQAEYGDFVLEFEIKLSPRGNSGVALRAPAKGDPAFDGLELQFADVRYNLEAKDDELTGAIYRVAAPKRQVYKPEEWNRCRVELRGSRLKVELNAVLIQDLDLDLLDKPTRRHDGTDALAPKDRPRKGRIGFQHLGRDDGAVEIRGARIRELK